MKSLIFPILFVFMFQSKSSAQIIVDGVFNEPGYSLISTRQNNNNGFTPYCEFTAIYYSRADENLYFGFECTVQNVPNQFNPKPDGLGIFLNFSGQQGKAAGQSLGIDTFEDFHFLNGGIELYPATTLEFKADFEVDYLLAVYSNSTPNQIIVDAATFVEGHPMVIQNLGVTDQTGTNVSGPSANGVFSAGSIELAFVPSPNEGSKMGFEIKIPLSEVNATGQNDWFQLFGAMVSSTGYFSDQTIPGNVQTGNSGWAPDYLNNYNHSSCGCPNPFTNIGIGPYHTPQIGPITILSPNGGEVWINNTINKISWVREGTGNIKIEFTSDGDTTWNTIVSSISGNIGSYYWLTPDIQSHFCRIRISDVEDSTVFDVSDNFFTIGRPTTEIEPNNTPEQANLTEISDSLDASINPIGDVDYFKFFANAYDTLTIWAHNINNSDLYARVEVSDVYGSIYLYSYFYPWYDFQSYFVIPFSGDYFIRVSYEYGSKENKDIIKSKRDSLEVIKRRKLNKVLSETGEYRISVKEFVPSAPKINFIYNWNTYYNSTVAYVEFDPMGLATNLQFEYGLTPSYGNTVEVQGTFSGLGLNGAMARLANLEAGSIYYFRSVAENDSGVTYGEQSLFFTPDRPEFWTIKSFDSLYFWPWLADVSFANENTGYILNQGNSSIFKTTDGGDSWIENYPGYYLTKIFCIDSANVYGLNDYGILKTTNGGLFWNYINISAGNSFSDFFFTDINTGYAVGYSGIIYKTSNGGNNWTAQSSGTFYSLYSVYFVDASHGWASGDYGTILKTTNGGTNWEFLNSGSGSWFNKVIFTDLENGYALTGLEGYIYRTTNGGNSWIAYSPGIYDLRDISFIDVSNGVLLGGYEENILRTTDGGSSWIPEKTGTLNYLHAVSKAGNDWMVVGDWGTILQSDYNIVSVETSDEIPTSYSLSQNYPNPFNPSTTFQFQLPKSETVTLKVYDILGNEVAAIVNEELSAGFYKYQWNAGSFASGVYIYKLQAGDFVETKKLILMK